MYKYLVLERKQYRFCQEDFVKLLTAFIISVIKVIVEAKIKI